MKNALVITTLLFATYVLTNFSTVLASDLDPPRPPIGVTGIDGDADCEGLFRMPAILPGAPPEPDEFKRMKKCLDSLLNNYRQRSFDTKHIGSWAAEIKKMQGALATLQTFATNFKGLTKTIKDTRESQKEILSLEKELKRLQEEALGIRIDWKLKIKRVIAGDLRHGHVCDATAYFVHQCDYARIKNKAGASDTEKAKVQKAFCTLSGTPLTSQTVCGGYDPSPDATNKKLRITYTCRDNGPRRRLTLRDSTTSMYLLCPVPGN